MRRDQAISVMQQMLDERVIQPLKPTSTFHDDPSQFVFFKGLNDRAQDGVLSTEVTDGLPAGTYRMASINSAANHQPVLVAIAQHGSLDDMVYVRVYRVFFLYCAPHAKLMSIFLYSSLSRRAGIRETECPSFLYYLYLYSKARMRYFRYVNCC